MNTKSNKFKRFLAIILTAAMTLQQSSFVGLAEEIPEVPVEAQVTPAVAEAAPDAAPAPEAPAPAPAAEAPAPEPAPEVPAAEPAPEVPAAEPAARGPAAADRRHAALELQHRFFPHHALA